MGAVLCLAGEPRIAFFKPPSKQDIKAPSTSSQRQMASNPRQMLKRYLIRVRSLSVMSSRKLSSADPSTIQNKFMVGYQGWYVFNLQDRQKDKPAI